MMIVYLLTTRRGHYIHMTTQRPAPHPEIRVSMLRVNDDGSVDVLPATFDPASVTVHARYRC